MRLFNKKPVTEYSEQSNRLEHLTVSMFEIPEEHLPEIIQLYDDVGLKNTRMAKFLLWKRIGEIIPSVKANPTSHWLIRFTTADRVIVYIKPEVCNVRK